MLNISSFIPEMQFGVDHFSLPNVLTILFFAIFVVIIFKKIKLSPDQASPTYHGTITTTDLETGKEIQIHFDNVTAIITENTNEPTNIRINGTIKETDMTTGDTISHLKYDQTSFDLYNTPANNNEMIANGKLTDLETGKTYNLNNLKLNDQSDYLEGEMTDEHGNSLLETDNEVEEEIEDEVESEIEDEVESEIEDDVDSEIEDEVESEIEDEIIEGIEEEIAQEIAQEVAQDIPTVPLYAVIGVGVAIIGIITTLAYFLDKVSTKNTELNKEVKELNDELKAIKSELSTVKGDNNDTTTPSSSPPATPIDPNKDPNEIKH